MHGLTHETGCWTAVWLRMCSTAREFTAPNLSCVRQGAHCDLFLLKLSDFQQKATDVAMLWCYIVVVLLYSLKFLSCQTLAKHPLETTYLVPILKPDHLPYVIIIMNINHNLRELNKSFFGSNSLYSLKNILDDQVLTYMWTIDTIYRRFLYFAWDNFKRKTFAYLPIQKLNLFSEIFILWPLFKIFKTISQIILIMYIIFMLNFFQKYNHTHTPMSTEN